MVKFPRFAVINTATTIQCGECHGKGYGSVAGFDGNERQTCGECKGFGGWEWVEPVDVEIALDAVATVTEIERHINPAPVATPLPGLVHVGMTAEFFDTGVHRAFANELSISRTSRASVVAVSSTSDPDTYYTVTAETCTCIGHEKTGRCLHRAFAIWHWWVVECDAVAEAAHVTTLEPIAA